MKKPIEVLENHIGCLTSVADYLSNNWESIVANNDNKYNSYEDIAKLVDDKVEEIKIFNKAIDILAEYLTK